MFDPPESQDIRLEEGREPPIGSQLVSSRRGYTHHAIYVGTGQVVQYGGFSRGPWRGTVEEVPLHVFSQGRPIWIRIGMTGWSDNPDAVVRARSRLGENRYHLITNNCEHFCAWCIGGEPRSHQVETVMSHLHPGWLRNLCAHLCGIDPVGVRRPGRLSMLTARRHIENPL